MIDLDQIDEQLESFRRKAILHSEIPTTRRSARHPVEDEPNEAPSPRPAHFRRHTAAIVEPAPELKVPPRPVGELREPPAPVVQPAKHRSAPIPSRPSPSPEIEQVAPAPPTPVRRSRRRQVILDPGMARLVADLVGHRSGSVPVASEVVPEPVPSVAVPSAPKSTPTVRHDAPSAAKPNPILTTKRVRMDLPARESSGEVRADVPRPVRVPVEGQSEEAWVARARLELAAPVGVPTADTGASEGDESEAEMHDLLDHCRERAYRHDDLQWRAALTLLLARTGRLVEARVEHEATASRFRMTGNPPGSWIDVGRTLSEAEAILAGGDGLSGNQAPSVRPARPSLSRDAIRQRVRDRAASPQPQPRPAKAKQWTSWEKTG